MFLQGWHTGFFREKSRKICRHTCQDLFTYDFAPVAMKVSNAKVPLLQDIFVSFARRLLRHFFLTWDSLLLRFRVGWQFRAGGPTLRQEPLRTPCHLLEFWGQLFVHLQWPRLLQGQPLPRVPRVPLRPALQPKLRRGALQVHQQNLPAGRRKGEKRSSRVPEGRPVWAFLHQRRRAFLASGPVWLPRQRGTFGWSHR